MSTREKDKTKITSETQRIFIENLPKPKMWWQEYIPLFIAAIALGVSIYSAHLSRKEFIASHRPYVYVSSRENDEGSMDVKSVLVCCINAPAKIIEQVYSYVFYKKDNNGKEEIIKTIPLETSLATNLVYPSDKTNTQIFFTHDFENDELMKDPNSIIRRRARVEYKELSTEREYYFEAIWDYNKTYNVWETNDIIAN